MAMKEKEFGAIEKTILVLSIFCFSFGVGLIVDGKKLFARQLQWSERVDYKNTVNPF